MNKNRPSPKNRTGFRPVFSACFVFMLLVLAWWLFPQQTRAEDYYNTADIHYGYSRDDIWMYGSAWTMNMPVSQRATIAVSQEDPAYASSWNAWVRWDVWLEPVGGPAAGLTGVSVKDKVKNFLGNPSISSTLSYASDRTSASVTFRYNADSLKMNSIIGSITDSAGYDYSASTAGYFTIYDPVCRYRTGFSTASGNADTIYSQAEWSPWQEPATPQLYGSMYQSVKPSGEQTFYYLVCEVHTVTGKTMRSMVRADFARYSITYNANGGTNAPGIQKQFHGYSDKLSEQIPNPPSSSLSFAKWNTKRDGSGTSYMPGDAIAARNSDLTLYAIYERLDTTLRLVANGGTIYQFGIRSNTYLDYSIPSGSYWTLSPLYISMRSGSLKLTRDFYSFNDFYDKNHRKKTEAGSLFASPGINYLYTDWAENTLTITYKTNGGGSVKYYGPTSVTIKSSDAYALTQLTPAKDYYHFMGWSRYAAEDNAPSAAAYTENKKQINQGGTMKATDWADLLGVYDNLKNGNASTKLFGTWEPNVLTIHYVDGTNEQIQKITYGENKSLSYTQPKTIDGYRFTGWVIDPGDATAAVYTDKSGSLSAQTWSDKLKGKLRAESSDVYLYPKYEANVYTITLDDNGGNSGSGRIYQKCHAGFYKDAACTQLMTKSNGVRVNVPTKTGYWFKGYYSGKDAQNKGKMITSIAGAIQLTDTNYFKSDATVYAQWEPNVYTITLDDNGGSGGNGKIYERYQDSIYQNYKNLKCDTKISKVTVPKRRGYDFLGYYRNDEGTDKQFIDENGTITAIKSDKFLEDVTMSARWEITEYILNYHSNYKDGRKEIDYKIIRTIKNTDYGENFKLFGTTLNDPDNDKITLSKSDYHFLGWSTDKNATSATYKEGDLLEYGDYDLYAVWEKDILEATPEALDADNPGAYHKPETEESPAKDWYPDSVTVRGIGYCNYAPVRYVYLSEPMLTSNDNPSFLQHGAEGNSSTNTYAREYFPADADGDGDNEDVLIVAAKADALNPYTGKIQLKNSKGKKFYIDTEAPEVSNFRKLVDINDETHWIIRACATDNQSGIVEAAMQKQLADGSWEDEEVIDLRNYLPGGGFESIVNDITRAEFARPISEDYRTRFRIAFRDAVGHESYTETFSRGPELELTAAIRRTNGTVAAIGEPLQMELNGDMDVWIDCSTKGYAEQMLYAVPACLDLRQDQGSAHVQLTQPQQLEALPVPEDEKERYLRHFDSYHFYLIEVSNDDNGNGADTIPLRMNEDLLEEDKVYDMHAWALREPDSKKKVVQVKFIRKRLGRRVIISQSWLAPAVIERDEVDELWFKWFFGWIFD